MADTAAFAVGALVRHRLFDYRGVVADVDPVFDLSDAWYERTAKTRPPKDEPWYRVLVHGASQETYVAQRNLIADDCGEPVDHPGIPHFFETFEQGGYRRRGPMQ